VNWSLPRGGMIQPKSVFSKDLHSCNGHRTASTYSYVLIHTNKYTQYTCDAINTRHFLRSIRRGLTLSRWDNNRTRWNTKDKPPWCRDEATTANGGRGTRSRFRNWFTIGARIDAMQTSHDVTPGAVDARRRVWFVPD